MESFEKNGKPMGIYVDCHATYKVNSPSDQFDREIKTRFRKKNGHIRGQVIYAKCPEGKGRVKN
jgi:hypothetical protein